MSQSNITSAIASINQAGFFQNIWQRKAKLFRKAVDVSRFDLSAEELAGFALEPDIESRIIVEQSPNEWMLKHGPFLESDFTSPPTEPWTLLVQSVDHFDENMARLKSLFRFIPDWRLDDVMVSFAPQGGSVGPHFDYYDVFLVQLSGTREWRLGQMCDEKTALMPHESLKLLDEFQCIQTHVLHAGDILYVPPGLAHWGVSLSADCMTASIGFRAPSVAEIASKICDMAMDELPADLRYRDQQAASLSPHCGQIPSSAFSEVNQLISDVLLSPKRVAIAFGVLMTEAKYELAFDDVSELDVSSHQSWIKRSDARMAYCEHDGKLILFANGFHCEAGQCLKAWFEKLCDRDDLQFDESNNEQIMMQKKVAEFLIAAGVYDE